MRHIKFLLASLLILAVSTVNAQPVRNFVQGPASVTGCEAIATDGWSPTYFFGAGGGSPYVTLSNESPALSGNYLTSSISAFGTNQLVVEINKRCHSTGKRYFRLTTVTVPGSDIAFGLASATHDNGRTLGDMQLVGPVPDSLGYQFFATNRKWRYASGPSALVNLALPANGNVIGIAVDLDTKKAWIRNETADCATWYGTDVNPADPVAGTNGYDFSSPTPSGLPWYIAWASNQNGGTTEGATLGATGPCTTPTNYIIW